MSRVPFAHASEAELARLFDFYRIPWQYEPRSFPIAWNERGRPVEFFTPDFYLPEYDLYIEVTVAKPTRNTPQEPKAAADALAPPSRQRQALYPPRRRARLFALEAGLVIGDPLFDSESIAGRVAAIGAAISLDYAGKTPLMIGLLAAAATFLADLARAVTIPCHVDFISVNRCGDGDGIVFETGRGDPGRRAARHPRGRHRRHRPDAAVRRQEALRAPTRLAGRLYACSTGRTGELPILKSSIGPSRSQTYTSWATASII